VNARSLGRSSWHLVWRDPALWNLSSNSLQSDVRGMRCHFQHDDYTYIAHHAYDAHSALLSIDTAGADHVVAEQQSAAGADSAGSRDFGLGKRVQ